MTKRAESTADTVSGPVLAKLLGVSPQTLQRHAAAGLVERVGRGRYALLPSVSRYCAHLRGEGGDSGHGPIGAGRPSRKGELWTLGVLEAWTGHSRRTLKKLLAAAQVEPADARRHGYRPREVLAALGAREVRNATADLEAEVADLRARLGDRADPELETEREAAARFKRAAADLKQQEVAQRSGELGRVKDMVDVAEALGLVLARRVEALPSRVAARVFDAETIREAEAAIAEVCLEWQRDLQSVEAEFRKELDRLEGNDK